MHNSYWHFRFLRTSGGKTPPVPDAVKTPDMPPCISTGIPNEVYWSNRKTNYLAENASPNKDGCDIQLRPSVRITILAPLINQFRKVEDCGLTRTQIIGWHGFTFVVLMTLTYWPHKRSVLLDNCSHHIKYERCGSNENQVNERNRSVTDRRTYRQRAKHFVFTTSYYQLHNIAD